MKKFLFCCLGLFCFALLRAQDCPCTVVVASPGVKYNNKTPKDGASISSYSLFSFSSTANYVIVRDSKRLLYTIAPDGYSNKPSPCKTGGCKPKVYSILDPIEEATHKNRNINSDKMIQG